MKDEYGYAYMDGFNWKHVSETFYNELKPVFRDGKLLKEWTLAEVRNNLHGGKF
jgi:hypothetical protein